MGHACFVIHNELQGPYWHFNSSLAGDRYPLLKVGTLIRPEKLFVTLIIFLKLIVEKAGLGKIAYKNSCADPEGGTGGPDPPGKIRKYRVP